MIHQPIFEITNHHVEICGKSPQSCETKRYVSYFENYFQEQLVFTFDYQTRKALLYRACERWERPWAVIDGSVPELTMNRPEKLWLHACWAAIEHYLQ